MLFPKNLLGLKDESPTYSLRKITAILSIAGVLLGLEITSLPVFLTSTKFIEYFNSPSPLKQGMLMSANVFGGLTGCVVYSFFCERFSRVEMLQIGALVWLFGSIMATGLLDIWMIIFSRWLKGISVGIYSILLAVYTGEIFPQERKGRVMAVIQLTCGLGMLSFHYISVAALNFDAKYCFRLVWALETIPAILVYVFTIWLPESPQWLTLHGQYKSAQFIQNELAINYNQKYLNRKPIPLLNKLDLASLHGEAFKEKSFWSIFNKRSWRQTLMGITLQLLVQFSGINVILYYITYICEMVGLAGNYKFLSASIPYFILTILAIFPVTFIDHVSRKKYTLMGSYPLSIIMILIGIFMKEFGKNVDPVNGNDTIVWHVNKQGGGLIITFCFIFVAIFAMTLATIPWIYTNELLPTRTKSMSMPVCMFFGWLTNFGITLSGPLLLKYLKWGTFILLGCMAFILSCTVLLFFPDTTNMSIEEIDNVMDCKDRLFLFKKVRKMEKSVQDTKYEKELSIGNSSDTFPIITEPIQLFNEIKDADESISLNRSI